MKQKEFYSTPQAVEYSLRLNHHIATASDGVGNFQSGSDLDYNSDNNNFFGDLN